MRETYKGALYLSLAASIWGGMYVASKYTLASVPPFTLLFIRYFLAMFILIAWCRRSRVQIIPRQNKRVMLAIGFFGYFLSIAAQFIGTKLSSAHMGAVITTLSPVFQSLFALLLLKVAITRQQLVAIALSFAGIIIVTDAANTIREAPLDSGNLFFLAAAALWGYYSILAKKVAEQHPPLQITTWGILLATLFTFPTAVIEFDSWDRAVLADGAIVASIAYLAVASTALAFYCWNKGIALLNPHQAGLFMFLQSIVGSLFGYLLLGETLSLAFGAGAVLILLAVYLNLRSA